MTAKTLQNENTNQIIGLGPPIRWKTYSVLASHQLMGQLAPGPHSINHLSDVLSNWNAFNYGISHQHKWPKCASSIILSYDRHVLSYLIIHIDRKNNTLIKRVIYQFRSCRHQHSNNHLAFWSSFVFFSNIILCEYQKYDNHCNYHPD